MLTELGFPELASLGGDLQIRGSESVPTCAATALYDQLVDAGWTGDATIEDTDDTGTCP